MCLGKRKSRARIEPNMDIVIEWDEPATLEEMVIEWDEPGSVYTDIGVLEWEKK